MKKSELKTGMRVTTTSGEQYIVYLNSSHGDMLVTDDGYNSFKSYNENLVSKTNPKTFSITKVESPVDLKTSTSNTQRFETIWELDTAIEMTIAELEKKLGITNLKIKK